MKLITEYTENDVQCIVEKNAQGEKKFVIEGIFMSAEQKNRNGRIYPKQIMERAVDKYVKEQVSQKRAVGELNHPEGPTVNLDKVSHLITDLQWEGNDVVGKAQILDTPMGKIVKVDGVWNNGILSSQVIENMETEIRTAPKKHLYETQVREYKNFLSLLKSNY